MNVISDTKKISLASHSAKEICMKPFEMKNFSVQYNLTSSIVKNIVLISRIVIACSLAAIVWYILSVNV